MIKCLPYTIIPLGILPGLLHLSWAWVICVFWLWFVIDPSRWNETLNKLSLILLYLYTVFCLWCLVQWFGWSMVLQYQTYLLITLMVFFLSYWITVLFNQQLTSLLRSSPVMIALTCITVLMLLMHSGLSFWSGIDIEINRWTSYTVSALIILSCLLPFRTNNIFNGIPRKIKPLLIVMIVVVFYAQYIHSINFEKTANNLSSYRSISEKSLQFGHTKIAINSILHESAYLLNQAKPNEAVNYIRSQWEYVPRERIAKEYRDNPQIKDNAHLFLTTFGGRVWLGQDIEIVDGILIHEPLQYIAATSKGDLIQITNDGIFILPLQVTNIHRIHHESLQQTLYGITHDQKVFIQSNNSILYFDLPPDDKWEDVVLAPTGDKFWVLHSLGGIVEYFKQNDKWNFSRKLYPPLWQETDLAIRLLYEEINGHDVFYVLDQCKGISARHPEAVTDHVLPKEDLFRFYHPDRRIAVDVKRYENKFVITDQHGQLDMIEKGVGDDFTDWKYSIRGTTSFDRNSGMWLRQEDTVALISYPEANTLIQLKRNGMFEPIAMPQGFRLVSLKRNGWWDIESVDDIAISN